MVHSIYFSGKRIAMDNFIVEFPGAVRMIVWGLLMTIKERMGSEGKPLFKNQLVNCDS
ncbi:hypothetical protein [Peribacillus sp. CSMR9]|uniref:hypothetical protein n=1 Tax=Peribacillus sp. CSMR9 TaxID=2981350 RepID=UPI00295324DC|nr:hypothetical protein [Peribacillus sp. CSMR9]MDV7763963.1 hypothetical protein [Peribacillus sp. CSMR9]